MLMRTDDMGSLADEIYLMTDGDVQLNSSERIYFRSSSFFRTSCAGRNVAPDAGLLESRLAGWLEAQGWRAQRR